MDHTVVSVGPYRFVTSGASSHSRAASPAGSASPPASTRSPVSASGCWETSACHRVGVACMTEAPVLFSSAASRGTSITWSLVARTTEAPDTSGAYSSRPAMSKAMVVTAASRSPGRKPNRSRMSWTKLVRLSRVTTTPLGRPVEPEV